MAEDCEGCWGEGELRPPYRAALFGAVSVLLASGTAISGTPPVVLDDQDTDSVLDFAINDGVRKAGDGKPPPSPLPRRANARIGKKTVHTPSDLYDKPRRYCR